MNGFPRFIAFRYSAGSHPSALVAFLSRLSMLGLVMGVGLLVTVLSVMNGFDREMRERILGLVPQITVFPADEASEIESLEAQLQVLPEVVAFAPFVQMTGLLIRGREVAPAMMYGVDVSREADVSRIGEYVDLPALRPEPGVERPMIHMAIGVGLAQQLGLEVGDTMTLGLPKAQTGRSLHFTRVKVVSVIHSGTELDERLAVLDVSALALIPGAEAVRPGLKLKLDNVFEAGQLAWTLRQTLSGNWYFSDWSAQFGNLYQAIQMSRKLVIILLLSVVAVAVFNVVSTLVMVVNDKQNDIAILRSMGATPQHILRLFLSYGVMVGFLGCLMGSVLGVALSLSITDIVQFLENAFQARLLKTDVYPISYVPSDLRWQDLVLVAGTAWVLSALATVYPAWRASRMAPADVLSHR